MRTLSLEKLTSTLEDLIEAGLQDTTYGSGTRNNIIGGLAWMHETNKIDKAQWESIDIMLRSKDDADYVMGCLTIQSILKNKTDENNKRTNSL